MPLPTDKSEQIKKEVLTPIYFEAGAALYDCQDFEYSLTYLLYHLSRVGIQGLNLSQIRGVLDGDVKKTAGQLNHMLKEHTKLPSDLEDDLQNALAARNTIVHRFLVDNIEKFLKPDGRESILHEMRELRSRVRHGSNILLPYIKYFMQRLDHAEIDFARTEARFKLFGDEAQSDK